ncbi:MAG TPA: hypothetical protein VLW54_12395, partial [Candidatus Acidoferrales bacterium]|nr:hypothetical protein [Candidatus Acidoferrales bacterium]
MKLPANRRGLRGLALAAVFFAVLAAAYRVGERGVRAEEPRFFAIKNARVVPVAGAPVEGATVVVADGLIRAVGKDVPIPPEAW